MFLILKTKKLYKASNVLLKLCNNKIKLTLKIKFKRNVLVTHLSPQMTHTFSHSFAWLKIGNFVRKYWISDLSQ